MITPTNRIAVETQALSEELWDLSAFFLGQWAGGVTLHSSWFTSVSPSASLSEQRNRFVSKPFRIMEADTLSFNVTQSERIMSLMRRATHARCLYPLYSDYTKLVAVSSGVGLTCDTISRRLYAGGLVAIVQPINAAALERYEVRRIASLTATTITLTVAPTAPFAASSRVYPLIEAQLSFNPSAVIVTDDKLRCKWTLKECIGNSALDPITLPGALPPTFPEKSGLPIFNISPAWQSMSAGLVREGDVSQIGIDAHYIVQGDRARHTFSMDFAFLNRADAWRLLSFFDSRGGQAFPFYMPSPASAFSLVSLAGTALVVAANCPLTDWTLFRPFVAFLGRDGTIYIRGVVSVARDAGLDAVTLDEAVPDVPIRRVSAAHLVRFNTDEVVERWATDTVMTTSLSMTEILEEKSVATEIAPILTGLTAPAWACATCAPKPEPPPPLLYLPMKECDDTASVKVVLASVPNGVIPGAMIFDPVSLLCFTLLGPARELLETDVILTGFVILSTEEGFGAALCPEKCRPVGCCHLPGGMDAMVSEEYCLANGGTYEGDDVECDDPPPPVYGCCTKPDSSTSMMTEEVCLALGGTYAGDEVPCPLLPCCLVGSRVISPSSTLSGTLRYLYKKYIDESCVTPEPGDPSDEFTITLTTLLSAYCNAPNEFVWEYAFTSPEYGPQWGLLSTRVLIHLMYDPDLDREYYWFEFPDDSNDPVGLNDIDSTVGGSPKAETLGACGALIGSTQIDVFSTITLSNNEECEEEI